MLLLFRVSNKVKYSLKAYNLLAHYHYLYSERMCRQLLWSRTINVHGKPGKNIPMDLHMEHLNRDLKIVVSHLGPNILGPSLQRAGKALMTLREIQDHFDQETGIVTESGYHSSRRNTKDLNTIIEQLQTADVFKEVYARQHKQFPKIKGSLIDKVNNKELKEWIILQLRNIKRYCV